MGQPINQPEPLGPGATGVGYAFIAMFGTAVVIAIGLAIALHGTYGIDGLGPIAWSIFAAVLGLPTAGIAGYFYGRQRGELAQMDHLMADLDEPLEPAEPRGGGPTV